MDAPEREWRAPSPMNLYDVLGLSRTAADDEIRRAYKRQREIFRDNSFPVVSIVSDKDLRDEQARIEEAYDTLLDPNRRRTYDLSTFPDDVKGAEAPLRRLDEAQAAELAMLQAEVAREITAETQFTGSLLRRVRESQGVEIADIAQRSKISASHIRAIEAESPAELPALVYVQGFVTEIAKYLRLDPTQVTRSYMSRFREISAQLRGIV
jgi:flagellar biosynthesis protein FlhG